MANERLQPVGQHGGKGCSPLRVVEVVDVAEVPQVEGDVVAILRNEYDLASQTRQYTVQQRWPF